MASKNLLAIVAAVIVVGRAERAGRAGRQLWILIDGGGGNRTIELSLRLNSDKTKSRCDAMQCKSSS
ncbi:hypothetical protein VTL71DRAFT_273 [Oculimacula yallundae]|uniref:Uncharacterized protein n=1 Tax=Oculimacula yallundae TaxID=86028 RepID=A0ABR4CZR6_9HELO